MSTAAEVLAATLESSAECDRTLNPANVVDGLFAAARAAAAVASAITPDAVPGSDAAGGHVASLTEAVMGVTGGLVEIARAIDNLADAVRSRESE